MRALRLGLLLVATFLFAVSAGASLGDQAAPIFVGRQFPVPPMQHEPWSGPKSTPIPAPFIETTGVLAGLGLPDPRGCAYRVIRVSVGDIWGGGGDVVETHGWVIPDPNGTKPGRQQSAITWNGLIYPTVKVGDKVDLPADITAMCEADEKHRKQSQDLTGWDVRSRDLKETGSVAIDLVTPTRVCLLLRVNEPALAEKLWKQWVVSAKWQRGLSNDEPLRDPLYDVIDNWVWLQSERALAAHMRGEDCLALVDAKNVLALQPKVDAVLTQHGIPTDQSNDVPAKSHFEYLARLTKVIADSEDRIQRPPMPLDSILKIANQEQRIRALVGHLNEVAMRQWSQPGGINLAADSTVQALIREEDPAVDPLLDCLEKDHRLTRSIHFWRDSSTDRKLMGAHEAAYVALCSLLDHSFFEPGSLTDDVSSLDADQRKALAKSVRDFWQKYKSFSREERWFAELADDRADADTWVQAAANIMRPSNIAQDRASMAASPFTITRLEDKHEVVPGPPAGQMLRKHHDPSVSDLLARRLKSLSRGGDDEANSDIRMAAALAQMLADWDGASEKQALSAFSERLRTRFLRTRDTDAGRALIPQMVSLYEKRAETDDQTALSEYASWIARISPTEISETEETLFEPFWKNLGNADLAQTADRMFNGAGSEWNPLYKPQRKSIAATVDKLMETPIVGIPAVRTQFDRELDDRAELGIVRVSGTTDSGGLNITLPWTEIGTGMKDPADPLRPKDEHDHPFRTCDWIAYQLAAIRGFPRFELYWPSDERDAARHRVRDFLRKYGARLEWSPVQDRLKEFMQPASLTFPLRDRPATAAETETVQAIFFLPEPSRIWNGVKLPIKAKMLSLHSLPLISQTVDATGKSTYLHEWQQEGYVWQAEETLSKGKWQRYYGFVGPAFVGKVPAEEIEFPDVEWWSPKLLGNGVAWMLRSADRNPEQKISVADFNAGKLPPMTIVLRNAAGLSREAPTDWFHPAEGALRDGFALRLERANGAEQIGGWTAVPLKLMRFKASSAQATLSPTEQRTVATFQLEKLCELHEPDVYRLTLAVEQSDDESSSVMFELTK